MFNKQYSNADFQSYVKSELNYDMKNGVFQHQKSLEASLTPYILEERNMNVTTMDVFSRLMKDRVLFAWGPVEERMCSYLIAQLLYLENVDSSADISMYINSPGGGVVDGTAVTDTIQEIANDVSTINIGMAASMGSVFLAAGTKGKRFSYISAKAMIHQASFGTGGHVNDNAITHLEGEKANFLLMKRLARFTDNSFDKLLELAERDIWMDSDEQMKFGIIDGIINNNNAPSISDEMEGFDEYIKKKNDNIIHKVNKFQK